MPEECNCCDILNEFSKTIAQTNAACLTALNNNDLLAYAQAMHDGMNSLFQNVFAKAQSIPCDIQDMGGSVPNVPAGQ